MSLKSLIQLVILLIIMIILGAVYFNYFVKNNKISLENNNQESETEISKNIPKKNGVKNLSEELNKNITEKSDKNITEKSDKNIDIRIVI